MTRSRRSGFRWVLAFVAGAVLYVIHDRKLFSEVLPSTSEGWTALLTGALFATTWGLWRSTDDLVVGADTTARRQLRAYVGIRRMTLLEQTKERVFGYEVWIQNFGQTPAFHVSCSTNRKIMKYPLPFDFPLADHEYADTDQLAGGSPTWISLQPGERRRITSSGNDVRLTDAEIASFMDSEDVKPTQIQLYCFGTISYVDVFGDLHWAHYCKSFGGDYYKRLKRGSACHLYNDSSDDPKSA